MKLYIWSGLMALVLYLIYHTSSLWFSVACLALTLLYFITSMFNLRLLQFLTVVLAAFFVYYGYNQAIAIVRGFSLTSYLELFFLTFLFAYSIKLFLEVVL